MLKQSQHNTMKKVYPRLFLIIIGAFLLATVFSCTRSNINITQNDNNDMNLVDSVAKVFNSVVSIKDEEGKILGSGFVLNDKIVTAAHVLYDKDKNYLVKFSDGQIFETNIEILDEIKDLAFLSPVPSTQHPAPMLKSVIPAKSDQLELGQEVFTIGYTAGFEFSVLNGIISGKNRNFEINTLNQNLRLNNLLQIDMNGSLGLSGAPVFNLNGEIIAMVLAVDEKTGTVFGVGAEIINKQ